MLRDRPGLPGCRSWRDTSLGLAGRLPFQGAARSSGPLGIPFTHSGVSILLIEEVA